MSKELEARLREADVVDYPNTTQDLCEEAADQLERYRVASQSPISILRGALASIIADPDCCAVSKTMARDALTYHANSADTDDMSLYHWLGEEAEQFHDPR